MCRQNALHLLWVDPFGAGPDDVLDAAGDRVIARRVPSGRVTREVPAIDHRLGKVLRVPPIRPEAFIRGASSGNLDDELTLLTVGYQRLRVPNPCFRHAQPVVEAGPARHLRPGPGVGVDQSPHGLARAVYVDEFAVQALVPEFELIQPHGGAGVGSLAEGGEVACAEAG